MPETIAANDGVAAESSASVGQLGDAGLHDLMNLITERSRDEAARELTLRMQRLDDTARRITSSLGTAVTAIYRTVGNQPASGEKSAFAPNLQLSTPDEIRLPLLWIAILHGRLRASLGATRGVQSATEVVKYLMAGADVVMTTSALLKNGIDYIGTLHNGLRTWMELHRYTSVQQMKGSMSQRKVADPTAFERANYIKTLESYKGDYL